VGCFIVSPNGMEYEMLVRLEFECTNNQVEYKELLNGLEILVDMGAKNIEAMVTQSW
jgi:ribonuclease HI